MLEIWGMWSTRLSPLLPGPLWSGMAAPDRVLSMGQNRSKLRTYANLNCLKWNCVLMLTWIVWNGTVFDIETVLALNWIVWNRTVWLNWIAWNRNVFDNQIVLVLNWIVWNRTVYLDKNGEDLEILNVSTKEDSPVGWGCRIHQLHLGRG